MAVTRIVSLEDAAELTSAVRANREFLAPWEPLRDEDYFTHNAPSQRMLIKIKLALKIFTVNIQPISLTTDKWSAIADMEQNIP